MPPLPQKRSSSRRRQKENNITNIIPTAATRFPYPALPSILRFFPVLFSHILSVISFLIEIFYFIYRVKQAFGDSLSKSLCLYCCRFTLFFFRHLNADMNVVQLLLIYSRRCSHHDIHRVLVHRERMISRMLSSPQISIIIRSTPGAIPACGGAP